MVCAFILIALVISAQTLPVVQAQNNNNSTKQALLAGAVTGLYCGDKLIGGKCFGKSSHEEISLMDLSYMGISICLGMIAALVGYKCSAQYMQESDHTLPSTSNYYHKRNRSKKLVSGYSASYTSAIQDMEWKKKRRSK